MNEDLQNLIDGYLDDQLTAEETETLNALLKENIENAKQFAAALLLHDRLRTEVQSSPWQQTEEVTTVPIERSRPRMRWAISALAAAALLLAMINLFRHGGAVSTASAATVALDRIIEVASESVDRVYRIHVTDFGPQGAEPDVLPDRKGRKPGIDGAELYVRGADQFVLIRHYANDEVYVTGSDGEIGWAVPPSGKVHLSRDARRFRRAVPGEHELLPFIDLRAGLVALRRDYELKLTKSEPTDEMAQERRLIATKRSKRVAGPERVEISFDAEGVAGRIELFGLKSDEVQARGLALELTEQRDLGPDFFKHETHHDADRATDWQ